jgi:hypothetical protein
MKNKILCFVAALLCCSCVSTQSTLKNVDDKAPIPKLSTDNTFVLTQISTDPKYGYDQDYPINVFYRNTKDETINQQRFLNALAGPKGEAITYVKVDTCCPFPTAKTEIGAGFLDVYEIRWEGQPSPLRIYLNYFEKGVLKVPMGLTVKRK